MHSVTVWRCYYYYVILLGAAHACYFDLSLCLTNGPMSYTKTNFVQKMSDEKWLTGTTWHYFYVVFVNGSRRGQKNFRDFSPPFIDGTRILRTSSCKDNAKSDMDGRAM